VPLNRQFCPNPVLKSDRTHRWPGVHKRSPSFGTHIRESDISGKWKVLPLHRRGRSRLAAALQPKTIEEAEIKLPDLIKLVQALPVGRLLSTGKA
jgi:hypothetical protein